MKGNKSMHLVLYIARDVEQADAVLKIWLDAGISGVTILESAGMQQLGAYKMRSDVSFMPTLASLLKGKEINHRTIFSAIDDDAILQRVITATGKYVGDWGLPDVGVLLVLPILQAYGLGKEVPKTAK